MNTMCPISPNSGVAALRGIALDVSDTAQAVPFFEALGATVAADESSCEVRAAAGQSPCVTLTRTGGEGRKLRRIIFAAPASDIDAIRDRAVEAGCQILEHTPAGLRLAGPDGIESTIVPQGDDAALIDPDRDILLPHAPLHGELDDIPGPISLCHAAIFVSAMNDAMAFYCGVLGLRLSDRCGDALAFLHSPYGGDHHILALVQSSGPGLHHYSFEMGTIDAIGLRAAYLAEKGHSAGWGLGRHVLGSNFFHYVRDPWGCHVELTTGLDQIPADDSWVAGDHKAEDAFYLWGPPPPADFIANAEAQPVEPTLVTA